MTKGTVGGARGFVPGCPQSRSESSPELLPFSFALWCSESDGLRFNAEGTFSHLYEQIYSTRTSPAVALPSRKLLDGNMVAAPCRGGEQANVGSFAVGVGYLSNALVKTMLQVNPGFQHCAYLRPPAHTGASDLDERTAVVGDIAAPQRKALLLTAVGHGRFKQVKSNVLARCGQHPLPRSGAFDDPALSL